MGANRERAKAAYLEATRVQSVEGIDAIERAIDAACAEAVQAEREAWHKEMRVTGVIDDAVAAEREACAKVAEDDDFIIAGRAYATAEDIAKRIRARSTVKPEPQIPMRNLPRASAKLDKDGK